MSGRSLILYESDASQVFIKGDFNNWTFKKMIRLENTFFTYVYSTKYPIEFKFWINDKACCSNKYEIVRQNQWNENNILWKNNLQKNRMGSIDENLFQDIESYDEIDFKDVHKLFHELSELNYETNPVCYFKCIDTKLGNINLSREFKKDLFDLIIREIVLKKCSICLDIGADCVLECNHIFHLQCVENWKEITNTCPNCRKKL